MISQGAKVAMRFSGTLITKMSKVPAQGTSFFLTIVPPAVGHIVVVFDDVPVSR